ncbi:MAG: hypothetical protein J3Q66DRAFT_110612 [Benniella sp.]|nr:MAG: hypothetical protein J3Q66DRAFT_110612 [Benniella sp.]
MSNILCPIIARYSLFFVLALSDSSRLARSKHPRQAVHELVLKAQQRFQAHYHASATTRKQTTLIRNGSTGSSTTYYSLSTTSSNSISDHNSNIESASFSSSSSASSPTPSPSACKACNGEFPCCAPTTSQPCECLFPGGKTSVTGLPEGATAATAPNTAHDSMDRHHAAAARTLPSPPPSPSICSAEEEEQHGLSILASSSSSPITPHSARHSLSSSHCLNYHSAADRPPPRPAHAPRRASGLANTHAVRAEKVARRRHRTKIISYTTLLSIAITVIFLSLLQTRRRNLRKNNPRSNHPAAGNKHRRHKTPSPSHSDDLFDPQFPSTRPRRRKHHSKVPSTMSTVHREVQAATANAEVVHTNALVKTNMWQRG